MTTLISIELPFFNTEYNIDKHQHHKDNENRDVPNSVG